MDVFDLLAKLSLDQSEYEQGLKSAKGSAESFGGIFGKIASGIGTATKVVAGAVTTVATGVGALTASAVKQYANYEQLVGGVETLFGTGGQELDEYIENYDGSIEKAKQSYAKLENAQSSMIDKASNAYKTAGMSANEYMETVTSFSASLIQSLDGDTEKAVDYADKAITDMSDNANKMGTDIESIQNAYQGFAKQNYTMLDNLKLGYGGTKSEMERLIEDADALSDSFTAQRDEAGNLTMSYSDIVDAIHIVQDNMGITGTTAKEASTTIEGSLNQMKASWTNLITGIADENANLDELSQNLIDSLVGYVDEEGNEINGFIDNIIPVAETALSSIGTLVTELVPEALELIPTLITEFLPDIIESAQLLITGLVTSMSENIDSVTSIATDLMNTLIYTITQVLPNLIDMGSQIITNLLNGISKNSENLVNGAVEIITSLITLITENLPLLVDVGVQILEQLATGIGNSLPTLIPTIVSVVLQITQTLIEHLPELIQAGLSIAMGLIEGLTEAIPLIVNELPTIIDAVVSALIDSADLILNGALQMFMAIVDAIPDIIDAVVNALPQIIDSIVRFLTGDGLPKILNGAIQMLMGIIQAIPTIVSSLASALPSIISTLVTFFINSVPQILSAGVQLLGGLLSAIPQIISKLASAVPSIVTSIASALKSGVSQIANVGRYLLEGLWSGISDKATWIYNQITSLGSGIINRIKSIFKIASPSKVFYEIGGYLGEGLGLGWQDSMEEVNKQIGKDLNYKGNIEVGTTVKDTTTAVAGKSLSDSDLDKLLSNLSINLYNTTEIDGQAIKKDSYKYTVTRMGDETRAVKVAMGGF